MELRAVVFLIVSKYDVSFAAGEDGTDLFKDMKETFTMVPGKLRLKFTPLKEQR